MRFEVHIPAATPQSQARTTIVEARNWKAALRAGLAACGEDPALVRGALCDLQPDQTVRLTDARSRRTFTLKTLAPQEQVAEVAQVSAAPKKPTALRSSSSTMLLHNTNNWNTQPEGARDTPQDAAPSVEPAPKPKHDKPEADDAPLIARSAPSKVPKSTVPLATPAKPEPDSAPAATAPIPAQEPPAAEPPTMDEEATIQEDAPPWIQNLPLPGDPTSDGPKPLDEPEDAASLVDLAAPDHKAPMRFLIDELEEAAASAKALEALKDESVEQASAPDITLKPLVNPEPAPKAPEVDLNIGPESLSAIDEPDPTDVVDMGFANFIDEAPRPGEVPLVNLTKPKKEPSKPSASKTSAAPEPRSVKVTQEPKAKAAKPAEDKTSKGNKTPKDKATAKKDTAPPKETKPKNEPIPAELAENIRRAKPTTIMTTVSPEELEKLAAEGVSQPQARVSAKARMRAVKPNESAEELSKTLAKHKKRRSSTTIRVVRPEDLKVVAESALEDIFLEIHDIFELNMSIEEATDFVMDMAMEKIAAESGSVLFATPNGRELYFATARGPKANEVMDVRLQIGEGIAGFCTQKGVSLMVEDVADEPRFASRVTDDLGLKVTSLMSAPIQVQGRVYGCIQVLNHSASPPFREGQLDALGYIGYQLARLIQERLMNQ